MIMRYQRISPDTVPVSNGRRTNSPSNPSWKTCKEEEDKVEIYGNLYMKTPNPTFEGKGVSRFRSPSKNSPDIQNGNNSTNTFAPEDPNSPPTTTTSSGNNGARNQQNLDTNGVVGGGGGGGGGGGDTFLQWGHRKRSRCSRGMTLADDTSSSTTSGGLVNNSAKIQRRSTAPPQLSSTLTSSTNANIMPPPSIPPTSNGIHSGPNLKVQSTNASSNPPPPLRRNPEERSQSGGSSRAVSGRSRAGKRTLFLDRKNPCSTSSRDDKKMNGCSSMQHNQEAVTLDESHVLSPPHPHQQAGCSSVNVNDDNTTRSGRLVAGAAAVGGGGEKVNGGGGGAEVVHHWPRIYIPLSRKEKEEDFLAMKGTKLPHRPKKRSKAIDRIIQFCYPGMWLSDLTKGRYEVREKKCPKKQKRRGLKGMESMESDSE